MRCRECTWLGGGGEADRQELTFQFLVLPGLRVNSLLER